MFISYTGRHGYDAWVAKSIADALEVRRVDYFLDQRNLRVGDDIVATVELAIAQTCTHLLLLASFASDKVHWVQEEKNLAIEHGLQLIPMIIAARENEVPDLVSGLKTLYAPLRREVATLFAFLGLGDPPDVDQAMGRVVNPDFLPALCDRKREEADFERKLNESERKILGGPKFYCLTGDYRAVHSLFIDRVRERILSANARFLGGATAGAPCTIRSIDIDWPVEWPPRRALDPLLEDLCRKLDLRWPQKGDLTSERVAELVASLRESVLVITHSVQPRRWRPETSKRILEYLKFWCHTASLMPPRQKEVVVFFNVAWSGMTARDEVNAAIEELEEKARRSASLPLFTPIPLSAIDVVTMTEWTRTFADRRLALRTKESCEKLFDTSDERELEEIIDEYELVRDERQGKSA